ncbi:MAG: GtrA family protein [Pseudomonadota bacterium]
MLPTSLLRYICVGLLSNGLLYVLFVLMVRLGIRPTKTAVICYILGLMFSYVLNRKWSFESSVSNRRDLPRFLFSYGIGLVATLVFITALTQWLPPEIAQVFNIGMTAITIYLCLRLTGFGQDGGKTAD